MSDYIREKQREELVEAIRSIDRDKVVTLLKDTIEKPKHIRYYDNWTLLHGTADCGMTDVTQLLVEKYQVDPHAKDGIGSTALHLACSKNHIDTVKYLVIHAQCEPLTKDYSGYTSLYKSYGETTLFLQDIIG